MSTTETNPPARRIKVKGKPGIYYRETPMGRRYEVTYLDSDGRRRWKTVPGNLEDAERVLTSLKAKMHSGEPVRPTRVTLSTFAEEWLEGQTQLRPYTRTTYEAALTRVPSWLKKRRLSEITVDDIAKVIGELKQKGYAAWTIRGVLTVLGRIFGAASRRGIVAGNPVRRLERGERPQAERREFPSLDQEAVGKLIAATPERYRVLVAVSVLTGIRQSEALGLRWQDVDVRAKTIRVRHQLDKAGKLVGPKTSAARREIPIPRSLAEMLSEHREEALTRGQAKSTDYVFASRAGMPLGRRNIIRRGLEKALEGASLPAMTWHDLRHVAASMMIAEGAPVGYVSGILGHSTPAITLSIYAHQFAAEEHGDRMRERMEASFGAILGNPVETTPRKRPKASTAKTAKVSQIRK
jgi:integrase